MRPARRASRAVPRRAARRARRHASPRARASIDTVARCAIARVAVARRFDRGATISDAVGRVWIFGSRDPRSIERSRRDRRVELRPRRAIDGARFELEDARSIARRRGAGAAPARDRDGATMPTTTMPTTTRALTMRATMRATRATRRGATTRCAPGRARRRARRGADGARAARVHRRVRRGDTAWCCS